MLTKDQILSARPSIKAIDVPEWGGVINVKSMSSLERLAWERLAHGDAGTVITDTMAARLLVYTLCDDAGGLLFTEGDVDALAGREARVLFRLFKEALAINSLTDDAADADVKNS